MLKLVRRGALENEWEKPTGMNETLYRVLVSRGIKSDAQARDFLTPSAQQLIDPFMLGGMYAAAERIAAAKAQGESVCVFGDYDVDGVSAAAILVQFFREWGVRAEPYIPLRHKEGYGLNADAVSEIAKWANLLVTVDCGITSGPEIALAKSLGLDVVVTDHHRPGENFPECTVVNPQLDGYPFPHLCGAGVAWKLAMALDAKRGWGYIDLAALATVADVVPLIGENRAIVKLGLDAINAAPRPGLRALSEVAGVNVGALTSENIAFQLAPRLNAGGRIGDAGRALGLLMESSYENARPAAEILNTENARRREIERKIFDEAERQLGDYDLANSGVIVLAGDDWNVGVVGLTASRLVEKYHMPVVLLSRMGDNLTGSCRSIPGVDIHRALMQVSAYLTRYGGHRQAAGLTLPAGALDDFRRDINAYILESAEPDAFVPAKEYDLEVELQDIDMELVRQLQLLEPFGFQNPAPVFLSSAQVVSVRAVGRDESHLKLKLGAEGISDMDGIWFGHGHLANQLYEARLHVLYAPQINCYMDRYSVQCRIEEAVSLNNRTVMQIERNNSRLLHDHLTSILYNNSLNSKKREIGAMWPPIDEPACLKWICESPRGTLLCASTVEGAARMLRLLEELGASDRLDLYAGTWPKDRRCFNALCVMPAGPAPEGYVRLIALDESARYVCGGGACARYLLSEEKGWRAELPDVDDLRALYVAVREMLSKPYHLSTLRQLTEELTQASGQSQAGVIAGLILLGEMELLKFSAEPLVLRLLKVEKKNPEDCILFQYMQILKYG